MSDKKPDWFGAHSAEREAARAFRNEFDRETERRKLIAELDRLELLHRLEPNIPHMEGESVAMLSLAISAKRVADQIDKRTYEERRGVALTQMVAALGYKKEIDFPDLFARIWHFFDKRKV